MKWEVGDRLRWHTDEETIYTVESLDNDSALISWIADAFDPAGETSIRISEMDRHGSKLSKLEKAIK